jgi:di/tricarboxylate transporter
MNHERVRASPPSKAGLAATAQLRSQSLISLGRATVLTVVVLAVAAGLLLPVVPGTLLARESSRLAAAVIFAASLVALAIGRVPGLAIDRAGVALVGAALMVACGALPLDDAYKAVDLDTLTLLLGMMIVVGFFAVAGGWIMRRAGRPLTLLIAITVLAEVFSAFLVKTTQSASCSHHWSSS